MSREQLLDMARDNIAHVKADTIEQADSIVEIPAEHYYDEERWALEMRQVFKRLPLMLAASCELPEPGDYKAITAAGVPMLISRGKDGEIRAFVNICSHRGSQIMPDGGGNTHRFTCPYHAWSYDEQGELTGVFGEKDFGELDKSCLGLPKLPVLERCGLIWVVPNPDSDLDMVAFLQGYDELLGQFGFENWHMFSQREVKGPNWKIAYDGYLDFYHLPILHKDTFGNDFGSRALYYSWGPHQRVSAPTDDWLTLEGSDEKDWPTEVLLAGVWTIFPHISIAGFDGGGRGVMISQLFPGDTPGESVTVQNYMMEKPPESEEQAEEAHKQFEFLKFVVEEEDYATGLRQQQALKTGARKNVMFGRNEAGGQNFHAWLDKILKTPDEELNKLFGA